MPSEKGRKDRIYYPFPFSRRLNIEDKNIINKLSRVLRKKKGDKVYLFDGKGHECEALIEALGRKNIILGKIRLLRQESVPELEVHLAFSLIRPQRADFILEKGSELGINMFIPFVSLHSQARQVSLSRLSHWRNVVKEACRQSGRLWLPEVSSVLSWPALVNSAASYGRCVVFDRGGGSFFKTAGAEKCRVRRVLAVIGPEGGFTPSEIDALRARGAYVCNISLFTLRAETAAVLAGGIIRLWADGAF